jgi:predicted RNA binding protein YcfA (HicA-like mRNA interferase family)
MSPRLPLISGRQTVAVLEKVGYFIRRQRGSHIRLYHPTRLPVTVPDHKELDRRTLKSILRTANVSEKEFAELL